MRNQSNLNAGRGLSVCFLGLPGSLLIEAWTQFDYVIFFHIVKSAYYNSECPILFITIEMLHYQRVAMLPNDCIIGFTDGTAIASC